MPPIHTHMHCQAPAPKVKISNLMSALGTDAILNPSVAEKAVNLQVNLRAAHHQEENASRALSKEEKHDKLARKYTAGTDVQVLVDVFRYVAWDYAFIIIIVNLHHPVVTY